MKRLLIVLAVFTLRAFRAHAGLYIPGEPPELIFNDGNVQPLPFNAFQLLLHDKLGIAVPGSQRNKEITQKVAALQSKGLDQLTTDELVSLSAYLVRLRAPEKALQLLRSGPRSAQGNFYVRANTALIHLILGTPEALNEQLPVKRFKPDDLVGMQPAEAAWFLHVESALFELEKLRFKELQARGMRTSADKWDDLFHVSFVGPSGEYEAGTIADDQKKLLPPDAIAVVQQLLLWLPDDATLYWLLAELYNATGNLEAAAAIFDECLNTRAFQPKLLREHRLIVREELSKRQAAAQEKAQQDAKAAEERNWKNHPEIIWVAGGVVAVPLVLLVYWQVREVLRRLQGERPTRH